MNPFDSKLGKVHSQLNEKLKEFESLSPSQQLIEVYAELLKANHARLLEIEELGLDEDLYENQFTDFEELSNQQQLSTKEQVYALKSWGVFEFLKEQHGITKYEAAFLLHLISGKSIENYRNLIASKETERLTNANKHKKKNIHRTLWNKGYHNEHGKKLLPKIDPIAYDEWINSKGVTDNRSELN